MPTAPSAQAMQPAPDFQDADQRIAHNRVWFNLLRIQRSMAPRISRALRAEGIEDPIWYEILLEIEREGAQGIQMAELERRLFVQQYSLSRIVSRLDAAGLIRRERMAGAGRAQKLFLSAAGQGLHERIWPTYMAAIQAELAHRLSVDEAYQLSRFLIRLYP